MQFTTKDLQACLLKSLKRDSPAARNSVARLGAVMISAKQLDLNEKAHGVAEPVVLFEGEDPFAA